MALPRALRIVLGVLAGLVLATLTLYFGAYFALASTPGRDALKGIVQGELERAGVRATLGDVHWGPGLGSVWATGVDVELPLASVVDGVLQVSVSVPSIAPERIAIHVRKVSVTLPEPGAEPPVVASAPSTKGAQKRISVPLVTLAVDELDLVGPGFAAHARGIFIAGELGDSIIGAITTGPCHVAWLNGRRVLGYDRCVVAGSYSFSEKRVGIDDVRVERDDDVVVRARGSIVDGVAHFEADLDLEPWDAAALAGDQLPAGLVVQGLSLDIGKDTVGGDVAALHAPRYVNAPFAAELVDLSVDRFDGEPGLLVPKVDVQASHLQAVRAGAFDWSAENVHAPHLAFALAKKLDGELPAVRIERWITPSGTIGPIEADVDLAIGLSGGSIGGVLTTPVGTIEARGRLKISPLTKRSSFVATAAFDDVSGPLALLVRHDGDDALRDALGEPLSGSLELAVEASRESKHDPFVLELEWDATELVGKVRRSWDGSEWVEAEAASDEHDGHTDVEAPE